MNDDEGSCVEKFVAFCKLFNPRIEKTIIAAHNFKGYDGIFILKELIKDRSNVVPFMNGLKIMAIQMDKTIFLDTLNFLPMYNFRNIGKRLGHIKRYVHLLG
jgi:hypothetical protein